MRQVGQGVGDGIDVFDVHGAGRFSESEGGDFDTRPVGAAAASASRPEKSREPARQFHGLVMVQHVTGRCELVLFNMGHYVKPGVEFGV